MDPKRWMRIGGLAAAIAALAFAAVYLIPPPDGNGRDPALGGVGQALAAHATGTVAPFTSQGSPDTVPDTVFVDGEGRERTLAEWRGKVVLVNLWATWCAPCRHEMPALDRLQTALGGPDFEVVAISIDRGGLDGPRAFLEEIGVETLALYNEPSARIGVAFGAFGMPTTILVGPDGAILGRLVGPAEWDAPEAKALVQAAIDLTGGA